MNRKQRKILGVVLLVCGIALLLGVVLYNVRNFYLRQKMLEDFSAFREKYIQENTVEGAGKDDKSSANQETSDESQNKVQVSQETLDKAKLSNDVIGILSIPSIGCMEPVKEEVISYCLGHIPETSPIGGGGNCAIAGHRNYNGGRYFHNIDKLKAGDEIIIETLDGVFTYSVTESFEVTPQETYVLEDYGGATLTLITCTPIYIGTHRLIIRADLVKSETFLE